MYTPSIKPLSSHLSAGCVRLLLLAAACIASSHFSTLYAQEVTVTNVFEQRYGYGFPLTSSVACPSGISRPAGQYPSIYHLEGGGYLHHYDPKNSANDYWVFVAHFDNSGYGIAELAIFKSTSQCGPFLLQTNLYTGSTPSNVTDPGEPYNADGGGYGFRPGGWQSRDAIPFQDDATQTYNSDGTVAHYANTYVYAASNSLNTAPTSSGSTCSFANDSMAGFRLTQDYLGIDTTTNPSTNGANWIFPCAQREGPVAFRDGSHYYLVTSQAAGWYPSQGGYGSSTNPLTGFQPSPLALGNASTFGGQSSGIVTVQGTQATSHILVFNHLGGDDSKNPANGGSARDTGSLYLPVILNDSTGTATMPWESSFSINTTTGVLTLPTTTNIALNGAATATVSSATANGTTTFTPDNAFDGVYTSKWAGSASGNSAFAGGVPTGTALCPITNATSSTPCNPSLIVDLGSVQPVQEVDLSFSLVKGSEAYITFKLAYSSDRNTWATLDYTTFNPAANGTINNVAAIPFSNPIMLGFNALPVNFSARYVALLETSAVQVNSTNTFYSPNSYEMAVIRSTAPVTPQPVTVMVTPATIRPSASDSLAVAITVAGPNNKPTPSGYIQLSGGNYVSDTWALSNGSNTFTIPAGSLQGGNQTLSVAYRPDTTGAPVYGLATTTGSAGIFVDVPDPPTNLEVVAPAAGALTATWTASPGATGYVVYRSTNGGSSYSQLASTSSTSDADTGLTNNNTYCYEVASVNAAGTGSRGSGVCAVSTTPVSNITVIAGSGPGTLNVTWSPISGTTGYVVKRSINSSAYSTLSNPSGSTFADSGLASGANVCYTVAATYSSGTDADSSPVCAKPTNATPPLTLSVNPWASGQIYLSWTVNGNASSYTVNRSLNGGSYAPIASAQTKLYLTDTGLMNGGSYCYTVSETLNGMISTSSAAVCTTATGSFLNIPGFSFETPTVGLWSTNPTYCNNGGYWTFVGNGNNAGNNSGLSTTSGTFTNANDPAIPLGNQVGILEGTGSLTQTLTGLVSGKLYTLVVNASQRQTSYQTSSNSLKVTMGGTVLGTFAPPQSIPYYRDYAVTFTASSSSQVLVLAGTSADGSAALLIDNIRIF